MCAAGLGTTELTPVAAANLSDRSRGDLITSAGFRTLDDYISSVAFWKQRFDTNGDGLFDEFDLNEFIGRKGAQPRDPLYHFAFDFDGTDTVNNQDMALLFEVAERFPEGYMLDPVADVPTTSTVAAYYPWYATPTSWQFARAIPLRGRYLSHDATVYLQQRLEAHASGIDVFAVSTFSPASARQFHAMQDPVEFTYGAGLSRFLWMYEILGRLPYTFNTVGQEIVNFDDPVTRAAFEAHMVELAGYFHENYLSLPTGHYPVWIWKTDTIRGDFVQAVRDARAAVRTTRGKELAIIGGELAQIPDPVGLERRLPAFLAMSHYGVYTPRYTTQFGGRLNRAHTDFTIGNLLRWIEIVRQQGANNIYQRPMTYWAPSQFGFDDSKGIFRRNNPTMRANRDELEYYLQQLDKQVVVPNADIVSHLNHTSYNEHREGHGIEPTDGYNGGRSWLQICNVYRGPSQYYRQAIVRNTELTQQLAEIFHDAPA